MGFDWRNEYKRTRQNYAATMGTCIGGPNSEILPNINQAAAKTIAKRYADIAKSYTTNVLDTGVDVSKENLNELSYSVLGMMRAATSATMRKTIGGLTLDVLSPSECYRFWDSLAKACIVMQACEDFNASGGAYSVLDAIGDSLRDPLGSLKMTGEAAADVAHHVKNWFADELLPYVLAAGLFYLAWRDR